MPIVRSYTDADAFLHTRGKAVPRKKYANNTYLHRDTTGNGVDTISLRLHNTDVVTWSDDGLITLNTGGWLTVTTKARINDVLPSGWHLVSNKGTWYLQNGWREASKSYRYQDGIQMRHVTCPSGHTGCTVDCGRCKGGLYSWDVVVATACPESQATKDDRHNAAMRKLIGQYLKGLEDMDRPGPGDVGCTLCLGSHHDSVNPERPAIVTYGDEMGDTQHLIDHMLDRVLPEGLVSAALTGKGYLAHQGHGTPTLKRVLRAYLSARLFVGATAPVHGRHPLPLTPGVNA